MATIAEQILKIAARRPSKGITVSEAYDALVVTNGYYNTNYDSVRGRVYELANSGKLNRTSNTRKGTNSGSPNTVFRVPSTF